MLCLADSYHFWLNNESLESLEAALPSIRHVHVSDSNRAAPGTSGKNDYKAFFAVLKRGGYNGPICVEANDFDLASRGESVLKFLKDQWNRS